MARRTLARLTLLAALSSLAACGEWNPFADDEVEEPDLGQATTAEEGTAAPVAAPIAPATGTPVAPSPSARPAELDAAMERERNAAHVSGMSVAIVRHGELVWSGGYGMADRERGVRASPDTVYYLASVAKTVTATALMQQWEREPRRFALDDDVGAAGTLPFTVRNPRFPDVPITYRQLMTHSSSIEDTAIVDDLVVPGDGPIPLATFIHGYLVSGGQYFDPANWGGSAPGSHYEYSNSGATLLGYVAERLAGEPLDAWCDARIFRPLGMARTSWKLAAIPPGDIAIGYDGEGGGFEAMPRYGQDPAYPSGALQSTATDMAKFLAAISRGGTYRGARILREETVAEMRRVQPVIDGLEEDYGLIFYYEDWGGHRLFGHSGAYEGFTTEMWLDAATDTGIVLLTNADDPDEDAMERIVTTLIEAGPRYAMGDAPAP